MKIIYKLFLCIIISAEMNGAVVHAEHYFPLKTGNVWSFNWLYTGFPSGGGTFNVIISKDTVINSKKYFHCSFPTMSGWLRVDSSNGNIYRYTGNNDCFYSPGESLVDSLNSSLNDVTDFCGFIRRKCTGAGMVNLFGSARMQKSFSPVVVLTPEARRFAAGIGPYSFEEGDPYPTFYNLRGAYIDGQYIGDTVLTGIASNNEHVPFTYLLSQNYPNPFNPSTVIKFTIPSTQFVSIKIYDAAGKYISALLNEVTGAGDHETYLNGAALSSGVYYYRIEAGNFRDTKMMLLLK